MNPMTVAALQAGAGALQSIFSGRKKREQELNDFAKQSPLYTPNKSIQDYYQQALNRYNENPYQSQQYQIGAKNIQRATAQGLGAMQDRRGGIGGASRLAEAQMGGMQNLGANAEAQRNARFGQFGQASQAKAAEDYRAFDINQMTPYNRQLQLKQMAAQAANSRFNAGLSMAGQGAGNYAQLGLYKEMYGKDDDDKNKKGGLFSGIKSLFSKKSNLNPITTMPSTFNYNNSQTNSYGLPGPFTPKFPVWNPATGTYE